MSDSLDFPKIDSFQRFKGKKLFLASSSDMRHARHEARTMLDGLFNRLVTEHRMETYEWETCTAENPFDQRLGMQENLGRPSDPNCIGVICLLGERIGLPLQDFDCKTLPNWENWSNQKRPYRVVHPWPKNKEKQLSIVKNGGFPLSGTVFEVLDALGANKKTHLAYFADRAVTFDITDIRLNGWNWRARMLSKFNANAESLEWLTYDYTIQTQGVVNFLNALNERGRYIPFHQTLQVALSEIRKFVEIKVSPIRLTLDNPYRFLDYYDILDGDDLPGREEKSRLAVAELRTRALTPDIQPMIAKVTGESGCGKTSFMRAGILAQLNRPGELGKFRVLAFRPTDFYDENGFPDHQLCVRILNIIAREMTDLHLSAVAVNRVVKAGPKAAQFAVDALIDALDKKNKNASIFVIGLDQFEEILDDLGAIKQRSYAANWKPLLNFIKIATQSGRFGFVYTLENSRKSVFETVKLPKAFHEAHEVRLGGIDESFLAAIITVPFDRAGFKLTPKIVNTLIDSYKTYSKKTQGYASILPLLSLKLSNLFDTIQNFKSSYTRTAQSDGLQSQFDDNGIEISYEEIKEELHLANEIEELANNAWGISDKPEAEQIDSLNPFLQPLMALSGDDLDRITLQTVGESLFVNMNERLSAFEDVRLVIRENGRRRLVHEAVIRQWPLASKWLEQKREYLVEEAALRTAANIWQVKGRKQALLPIDRDSIAMAVAVLRSYLQEWPYCAQADLSRSDRNLKDYCQAIFEQSNKPAQVDTLHFRKAYSHIHIAAAYGLTDLVEKFLKDTSCLELRSDIGTTPIDHAAWSYPETTRFLIEKRANPVNFDEDGWSTISRAVWRNDAEIFRLLLPYYNTIESIKAPQGTSLLHIAARRGAVDMAKVFLATIEGINPDQKDDYGRTPFIFACIYDQPEAFDLFLEHCDVRYRPSHGWTILHYAALHGAIRVVDKILNLPQFYDLVDAPTSSGQTALMVATQQRQSAVVERLVKITDINYQVKTIGNKKGWTALHFAIAGPSENRRETRISRQQALRTVRVLLAMRNIDPSIKTNTGEEPIALATSLPQVCRALIAHPSFSGNERLPDGTTPLNSFIKEKDRTTVERMLRLPDLDIELLSSNGDYALSLLIGSDMPDLALKLLEEGRVTPWAVTDAKNIGLSQAISVMETSLITAYLERVPKVLNESQEQHISDAAKVVVLMNEDNLLLKQLISLGANPNLQLSKEGWTLLHYSAVVGNIVFFDLLKLKSNGILNRDTWGRTLSDLAPDQVRDQFEIRMKDFVEEDSPMNPISSHKKTSARKTNYSEASEMLFTYARFGDIENFAKLLKDPDTDPNIVDEWGRSPAEHAPDNDYQEIADLLHATIKIKKDSL